MPKYAANLSTLFGDLPFLDRFKAARDAGFAAVECQFPYAFARAAIAEKLAENGLELVLFNLPAGDFEAGERGLAALPGREAEFRDGCRKALAWAKALGCSQVNCLVGAPPVTDAKSVRQTMVENVRFAAQVAEREGVRLLLEPLNRFDAPLFALHSSADALALFDEAGERNVWLQYDLYHMQRGEGELAGTMKRLLPRIAHIQISDNPGRHEPGTGEINFQFLLPYIDAIGYRGWIGCEYWPTGATLNSFGWMKNGR
jgi:hydroxypyruvate isomerase